MSSIYRSDFKTAIFYIFINISHFNINRGGFFISCRLLITIILSLLFIIRFVGFFIFLYKFSIWSFSPYSLKRCRAFNSLPYHINKERRFS